MNATLLGLFAVAVWSVFGVLFIFVRGLPVFEVLTLIFFIGYIAFTIMQLVRGEDIRSYWKQPLAYYAFWLAGAGLYTVLIYIAFMNAPIFEANMLNYLWPILLVIFSAAIYKEPLPLHRIIGMLCGFAGAFAILMPAEGEVLFANFSMGHALAVAAAVVWALYSALTRNRHYPQGFQAPMFLVLSMICLVIHLVTEPTVIPNSTQWIFLLLLGSLRISYALWDYGMKKGNVTLLASMSYFLPFLSSVFLILAGERPAHPLIATGAILICIGCLTVNYGQLKNFLLRKRASA
jgi:drug/metabolite transporter (DMT)-like permease